MVVTLHASRTGNRERVLRVIVRDGPLARVAVARRLNLTTAAISVLTRDLIERGLLREVGHHRAAGARTDVILLDMPDTNPLIGAVHQGASMLRVGLCTLRGRILVQETIATPQHYDPAWAAAVIAETLAAQRQQVAPDARVAAVGVGAVGLVDVQRGMVKRAPRLGWEAIPFRDLLTRTVGVPVVIENNVRAMAVGEALFGQGRSWSSFAFVYLGSGVGSGLIINGAVYRGVYDGAGEIGHITIEQDGEVCLCGNRGCLETLLAESGMVRRAQARGIALALDANHGDGMAAAVRTLIERAAAGDEVAGELLAESGTSLGYALAGLVNVLNPSHIVLHGTLTAAEDLFVAPVEQALRRRAFLATNEAVKLVFPTFGDDAGLVGAAAVALEEIVLATAGGRVTEEYSLSHTPA